jgi:hypothetical protein
LGFTITSGLGFLGGSTGFSAEHAEINEMQIKLRTRYLPAIADIKMLELSFIRFPGKVHLRYQSAGRSLVTPTYDLLDPLLFPFEHGLDAAVRKVLDPAFHADPHCRFLRAGAEINALDKAVDDHMRAKIFHLLPSPHA